MKKYAMIFSVLLVAAALVTGSIAYFTDSVETKNVIASGTLDIEQHEYERKKENGAFVQDAEEKYMLQPYTQNQPIYPSSITSADIALAEHRDMHNVAYVSDEGTAGFAGAVSLYKGNIPGFIDKIVTVENVGSLITYVRTFVAVPACYHEDIRYDWIHLDLNRETDEAEKPCWEWTGPYRGQLDGVDHDIYVGTYQKQLLPGEFTPPSLLGFSMDGKVDHDGQDLIYKTETGEKIPMMSIQKNLEIQVKSEASQAIVFDTIDQAMVATFGALTETVEEIPQLIYHPWMNQNP